MSVRLRHVGAIVTLAAAAGCATNPATGESQLSVASEQQEVQMGRQAAREVRSTLGLVENKTLQYYVGQIGQRLAAESERPDLPWTFEVIDDPAPNAFALPGGFIYVTRGMLNLLTSEAELAGVLGHEIAHVTARHSVNQISKQQLAQLGVGIGGFLFPEVQQSSPAIGAGLNLLFLKYSRDDEREADELGFRYVRREGYSVWEFDDVFAVLERGSRSNPSALPTWLSTHPSPGERVETAKGRALEIGAQPQAVIGREAYLRHIDGLVYGQNPRRGFFRNGVFYHPELRFHLRFPRHWQTRNLAQAVVGSAPAEPVAFQLSIAAERNPASAMARFRAQRGLRTGAAARTRINGLAAVTAPFEATTEQGMVRGHAAFVEYGGRTYQLAGYAAAGRFAVYGRTITQIIQSFGRLTDPRTLSVQPKRIDIVRLSSDQTLREFARRFPSPVPLEQLALVNQVPQPSTLLRGGTLIKRVVG